MTVSSNQVFNGLPSDIILDVIATHLSSLSDVSKLLKCSKEFDNHKADVFKNVIDNDEFLHQYLKKRNLDLITTIEKSSFSQSQFFALYDNVNKDGSVNKTIKDIDISNNTKYHCLQLTIDCSFELFKILMCVAMYRLKFQFRNTITIKMINHFKNIYLAKFKKSCDTSHNVFLKFIEDRDELLWYLSNINLYNVYENINLMHSEKRSFVLKQNIESDEQDSVVKVVHNHIYTINALIKIFGYLDSVEAKIYILYNIFNYTTIILLNKDCSDNFGFNCESFVSVVSTKIEEFERDIEYEHRASVPRYLRTIMLERVQNHKRLILNYMGH